MKVTAQFSNLDAAETAARSAKKRFDGIEKVNVKYKYEDAGRREYDILTPPATFNSGVMGGVYYPSYLAEYRDFSYPMTSKKGGYETEVDINQETVLELTVGYENAKAVGAFLRSAGGLSVKIT